VRPEEYKITSSIWQATWALSLIAGPLLAGVLISAFPSVETGITIAFIIDSLSFVASGLIIFVFARKEVQDADASRQVEARSDTWSDITEGMRSMWDSEALRGVALLYAIGMLGVGSVFVLIVPYVQTEFQGGPLQIGLLETAMACGILVGAAGMGASTISKIATGRLLLGASFIGATSATFLGMVPTFLLALLLLGLMGASAGTVQTAAGAVVLHHVPQRHQGKANAALNMLLNLANVASMGSAGILASLTGIRGTFGIGGLMALLGVMLATPLLIRYRTPDQANSSSQLRSHGEKS
jgi:predicted MFS family arabinose efflux permease